MYEKENRENPQSHWGNNLLEINNVVKRYGDYTALNDVS